MRTRSIVALAAAWAGISGAGIRADEIALDAGVTFQTVNGWEQPDWLAQADSPYQLTHFHLWRDTVLDRAVDEVGVDRIRVALQSGLENSQDWFARYVSGEITRAEWRTHWNESINDDANPFSIDPDGFHWSRLDHNLDAVVVPLRQRLQARGESLYVNLCYADWAVHPFEHADDPEEYAEYILAAFLHMDEKYGFVPDAVEVVLEADLAAGWLSGRKVGLALVAAGRRLAASGYAPDFIAPTVTDMSQGAPYFDDMMSVPGVQQYVKEICYHRYQGVSTANLQAITQRAVQYGLDTSMGEYWHPLSNFRTLHDDLTTGRVSAWQQGSLAGLGQPSTQNSILFAIDATDPENPRVVMNHATKYTRHYYKHVRRGAVRIEATTDDARFDPVAFVNADGRFVVVVNATSWGNLSIRGLPAGTYGIWYTTGSPNHPPSRDGLTNPDQTIRSGQSLATNIPAAGVITIFARSGAPTPPPAPPQLLVDGGFERQGTNWQKVGFGGRSIAGSPIHGGLASMQMVVDRTWPREVYQDVPVVAGTAYDAAAWVRTSGAHETVVQLVWLDAGGSLLSTDLVGAQVGSRDWTRLSGRFAAPARSRSVRFKFLTSRDADGAGSAWFDDAELSVAPGQ